MKITHLITACLLSLSPLAWSQDCQPVFRTRTPDGNAPGKFRVNKLDTLEFKMTCVPEVCEMIPESENLQFTKISGSGMTVTYAILPLKAGKQKVYFYFKCPKGTKSLTRQPIEAEKKTLFVSEEFVVVN